MVRVLTAGESVAADDHQRVIFWCMDESTRIKRHERYLAASSPAVL